MASVISDKIDFETKIVMTGKEHYIYIYMMIKDSILQEENITVTKMYAPNYRAQNTFKKLPESREIDSSTTIVGGFNNLHSIIQYYQHNRKKIEYLTRAISQLDLIYL